jgi:glucosamine--fructose-6-phosphate aminotransferase (isomerizing)
VTQPHERLDLFDADIQRQPEVLKHSLTDLRANVGAIASAIDGTPEHIYFVGCGDSLDAGSATQYVWQALLGVRAEAVPAMTFSTTTVDYAPAGSLVVAVSQSGKVSRVVEAVRAAHSRGLKTVSITARPDSPLGAEPSTARWIMDFEKLGPIPGTTSHLVGCLALHELAAELAGGDAAERLRAADDELPRLCREAAERTHAQAVTVAGQVERSTVVLAVGYGRALPTARFAIRKILETSQLVARTQETEEYAHDDYSIVGADHLVILFAPSDRGLTRSAEIAPYLARVGARVVVVTTDAAADRFDGVTEVMRVPDCQLELAPLVFCVPAQLLAAELMRSLGGSFYGMAEHVHAVDGDPQIYESAVVV